MLCRVQTFVGMSMDLITLRPMALLCTLVLMGKYILCSTAITLYVAMEFGTGFQESCIN